MALRDYLAEEVARECAATRITRREALRQLGLMGLSVTAAGALLAACAGSDDNSATPARPGTVDRGAGTTATTAATPASTTTVAKGAGTAEAVTFAGPQGPRHWRARRRRG